MNNQIRGNNACKNCCKEFANDCFNTLYDTSIMVDTKQLIHINIDNKK